MTAAAPLPEKSPSDTTLLALAGSRRLLEVPVALVWATDLTDGAHGFRCAEQAVCRAKEAGRNREVLPT